MFDPRQDPTIVLVLSMFVVMLVMLGFAIDRRDRELKEARASMNSCMVNLTHCLSSGALLDKVSGRAYFCDVAKIDGL